MKQPKIKLTHWLKGDKAIKDVNDAVFLLSNKNGGYLSLALKSTSRHQGFYLNEDFRMFKLLESIRLPLEVTSVLNKFSSVMREYGKKVSEEFTVPFGFNAFIYEINSYNGQIGIDLDCREAADNDDWGRFYNIVIEKDKIIINYEKQSSYRLYLVITGKNIRAEKVKEWKKVEYELDKSKSGEYTANIFTALNLFIDGNPKLVFSASTDKDKAIKEGDYVFRNINKLKRKQLNSLIYKYVHGNKDRRLAYNAALNSVNSLLADVSNYHGIISGFPSFFQLWARDELISLNALSRKDNSDILMRYLTLVQDDGLIPSRYPHLSYSAIDSIGWFYLRLNAKDRIESVLNALKDKHEDPQGFIVNKPNETWMDSIDRSGARLEVQSFKLFMLHLFGDVHSEMEFKDKVRKEFWNGKILADGIGDSAIRPNIFLSYYIYPDLLSIAEWKKCFKNALSHLWS